MAENEDLEWLLKLLSEIKKGGGNDWFWDEIYKSYCKNKVNNPVVIESDFDKVLQDLRRTKSYLQSIDKTSWLEGIIYHEKIKFPELKIELVSDYKEMKIAEKQNDIIEYTRRLVMQLENCLNSVCQVVNAYEVIKATPEKFKDKKSNLLSGDYAFFDKEGKEKPLAIISIQSKVFFVNQFYQLRYSYSDIQEMIVLRNNSSHRGKLKTWDAEVIKYAKQNVMERKASYFKCFDTIYKGLAAIF